MRMNTKELIMGIVALGLSLPVLANESFAPYVGIDGKLDQIKLKKAAGANLIAKNYPQGNLFAGMQINEWLGFEVGFESTTRKNKTSVVQFRSDFFGVPSVSAAPVHVKTKTKVDGFHVNVVGFYPIMQDCSLNVFGSLGLARLKLRTRAVHFFENDATGELFTRNFVKETLVPRVTVGVQSMLNECIGVRAMLTWEKTSAFKTIYAREVDAATFIRPKDSKSVGLGVFYRFS